MVSGGSINAWDFAAHRTNVSAQLATMVNDIEQCDPKQSSHGVLEQDLFFTVDQPCLVVPTVIVQGVQLICEAVMIPLLS
jgi:hypothetical protein